MFVPALRKKQCDGNQIDNIQGCLSLAKKTAHLTNISREFRPQSLFFIEMTGDLYPLISQAAVATRPVISTDVMLDAFVE